MGALADASAYPLSDQFATELERHRRELTGYCYRMMGAGSEAEDAVQETFLRAWRARGGFERRAALRSWLYKIATNVCIDMPQRPQRRARPMDLASVSTTATATLNQLSDDAWVQPIADSRVLEDGLDPAELAVQRDTLRLAFIAALAYLPRRQRAVLILREVLHWHASEVADLLDTTTASVNSALQRARATLDELQLDGDEPALDDDDQELLDRYVGYFERYDIDSLVTLLREDATFSMPPYALWIRGPQEIHKWMLGPGAPCRDGRVIATHANGGPAFATYRVNAEGSFDAWSLQMLEIKGGQIAAMHNYLNTEILEQFGLPLWLPE